MKLVERHRQIERHVAEERRERDGWTAIENALAPPGKVQAFRIQLDDYDTRTVEALMENREALDVVQRRIEQMMSEAHVLPDGRRVFKTEDGQRVYDEHGQVVPPEIINPNEIDNRKPRWEALQRDQETATRLAAERQQLLDYQRQLDQARERLDRGEITNGELDKLKADLAEKMPEAIRHKLDQKDQNPEMAKERDQIITGPTTTATTFSVGPSTTKPSAAMSDDGDAFLRQSGLGPAPVSPKL